MDFLLLLSLAIALVYFSVGVMMQSASEKSIICYRSRTAAKNIDTRLEANQFAGRTIMITGCIVILASMGLIKVLPVADLLFPALAAVYGFSIAMVIILTEQHLRKNFFRNGKRRPV